MKKTILFLLVILLSSFAFSQTKADLSGVWLSKVEAGEKPTTSTFFVLNADGSYIWGTDSLGNYAESKAVMGKWDLTLDKEIKIIPDNKSDVIRYYRSTGADNIYKYKYYEKDGQKIVDKATDMTLTIQRLNQ